VSLTLGQGTGPLRGIKVVEIASIGPGPHACMILADLGADVIRIERPGDGALNGGETDFLNRGRPSVVLDLKVDLAVETVLRLVEGADALVEGMRPGAMERLGLGPEVCFARNPGLVYGRMTGWGQTGPLSTTAGHDLNYIALAGVLHGLGQQPSRPQFPSNLLGDFGGGSTYLVIGMLAALLERRTSGVGQVVDAAIVDGTAHLNAMTAGFLARGVFTDRRASNLLDGGVPWYDVYETSDGRHLSLAALEPQFYAELVRLLGLADIVPSRDDPGSWHELRRLIAEAVAGRTADEWTEVFEGSDACVMPILTMAEAAQHPHLVHRQTYVEGQDLVQPAPAPRFSRTHPTLGTGAAPVPGIQTRDALAAWGITNIERLIDSGAARVAETRDP
jgi:alpha-methylacyl-CoA racemase